MEISNWKSEIGNRKSRFLLCILAVCAGATGCRRAADDKVESKPAVEKIAERGPIRLKVSVNKDRVAVAEPLRMTIEMSAPEGYQVQMPPAEEALGSLRVRSAKELAAVASGGTQRWRWEYELESLVSGEQTIPAMTVHYRSQREPSSQPEAAGTASAPASAVVEGDLSSEPFTIQVTSALAADANPADLTHLRDIKGAVEVPVARSLRWAMWMAVAIVTLTIIGAIAYYVLRVRGRQAAPPISPGTWAFQQFRRLEADRLIEQGLYNEFYFRLSDIVRQYIERRFGLMAPERTTDEFLREVRLSPALSDAQQMLLRDFLESSDQVKFALYEPTRDEAESAFARARDFVDETAYTGNTNGEEINRTDVEVAETA